MSEALSVSVAMATYNGGAFIDRQLASLATQTRLPDELVVGDDGSTDDTLARVAAFAAHAPFPVRVLERRTRLGYRRNFLEAGRVCTGQLVFFCDQDDEWLPGKIGRMIEVFRDPQVLLAYHDATVVGPDGRPLFMLYDAAQQRRSIDPNDPSPFHFSLGFTQAYRSRLHAFDDLWPLSRDHVAVPPEPLAHDQWYFLLASILGKVAYVDEPLVRYRQHGANAYGIAAAPRAAFADRVKRAVVAPGWADRSKSISAMSRSAIVSQVASRVEGSERTAALDYAERYRVLGRWLARRHESSHARGISTRVAALASNVLGKAYAGGDAWHLQTGWLLGDILRVLRGPPASSLPG